MSSPDPGTGKSAMLGRIKLATPEFCVQSQTFGADTFSKHQDGVQLVLPQAFSLGTPTAQS